MDGAEGAAEPAYRTRGEGAPCHARQAWPPEEAECKIDDSEATASPRPARAREQQQGRKAGDVRRRIGHGPATPPREGESWWVPDTPLV